MQVGIIGAGPAGLLLSRLLALFRVRVLAGGLSLGLHDGFELFLGANEENALTLEHHALEAQRVADDLLRRVPALAEEAPAVGVGPVAPDRRDAFALDVERKAQQAP